MSSKFKKWFRDINLKDAISYFVLALFLLAFIKLMIGGIFGYSLVVIQNGPHSSMWPTYDKGDMFLLHHAKPENIHLGDVIVYVSDNYATKGMLIIHRVVNIVTIETAQGTKYYYQVSGDNPDTNNVIDVYNSTGTLIPYDAVKGKTIFLIPKVGYIRILFTDNILFRTLFIVIFVGLAIYIFFSPEKKEEKNEEKEKELDTTKSDENEEKPNSNQETKLDKAASGEQPSDEQANWFMKTLFPIKSLFTNKKRRTKLIITVGSIILIIVMIPVIDTLISNRSLTTGINEVDLLGAYHIQGNDTLSFIFVSFIIHFQHDGSWNKMLKSFTVYGIQHETTLATMKWYSFYQKEGDLRIGGSLIFETNAFNFSLPLTIQINYTIKQRFGPDTPYVFEKTFNLTRYLLA